MSQQLDAYVSAKQRAILAVLDMLASERRLVEFGSGTTDLFAAEEALDEAAASLAAAVDGLPDDLRAYRRAGWGEPPAVSGAILIARHRVAKAALRCLSSDYADEHSSADAEAQHADEQLALACRNLAADVAAKAEQASVPVPAEPVLPFEWPAGTEAAPVNRKVPLTSTTELARTAELRRGSPLTRSVPSAALRSTGIRNTASRTGDFPAAERAVPEPKSAARRKTGFGRAVKLQVRTRAGNGDPDEARCEAHGGWLGPGGGDYQHIVARGMGGCKDPLINSAANCALLCRPCHGRCESRNREMLRKGFWLPQNTDPRTVPMKLWSGVTAWRTVDGRYLTEAPEGVAA